jgi:hypothetical protein
LAKVWDRVNWQVVKKVMIVKPVTGAIKTKEKFANVQLPIEYCVDDIIFYKT